MVNLKKGEKVDLTKGNPGLKKLLAGLSWDIKQFDTGGEFDLDVSVFLLNKDGVCGSEGDFIFYGKKLHASKSVEYMGDNRTGEGEGDDEQIKVNLSLVPEDVDRIVFAVSIYEADERGQNFGQVRNAWIRLYDEEKGEQLIEYDLDEEFSIETSVVVGEIYRYKGEWKFNAIGSGYEGGLAALCSNYGIEV